MRRANRGNRLAAASVDAAVKRALLLFGVLATAGVAAYSLQWSPGAKKRQVCDQLHDLCGSGISEDDCRDALEDAPEPEVEELARCVEPADACLEVAGCLVGTGARQLTVGLVRGLSTP